MSTENKKYTVSKTNPKWDLDYLKDAVETTYRYDKLNHQTYNNCRRFIYYKTLDDRQVKALKDLGKPPLSFNSLEAYVSRLRGELAKHVPAISIDKLAFSSTTADQLEFIEGYIRNVIDMADQENLQNESYNRTLTGGYNVMKVYTDYSGEDSFWQDIKVKNCYDPTLCGFDPTAIESHKGDGEYCFEMYPMEIGKFKRKYPKIDINDIDFSKNRIGNFKWAFRSENTDYVLVCDMYVKEEVPCKIVQLPDGSGMYEREFDDIVKNWNQTVPPPVAVTTRDGIETKICRIRFIQTEILEEEETDFYCFPLIYIDGNKVKVSNSNNEIGEVRRPYFWQAMDMQKLKDRAGQTWAYWIENMVMHKWIISLEAMPFEDQSQRSAYTNNQVPNVMMYHEVAKDNPNLRLTPPQPVQQAPMPESVMNAFMYAEKAFQFMLGSFDSALGINDNQLSGTAILEGATQTNAAAMPYLMAHLQGMGRVGDVILDLIPKYVKHQRTVEIMDSDGKRKTISINGFNGAVDSVSSSYNSKKLKVKVKADVNFSVQQTKSLNMIQGLSQYIPSLAQFFGSEFGAPIILKNVEFNGADEMRENYPKFIAMVKEAQEKQQQTMIAQAQNNPQMLRMKNEQQKLAFEIENSKAQNQLKMADLAVQDQKIKNEQLRTVINSQVMLDQQQIEKDRLASEQASKAIDVAMKTVDMTHKHKLDRHKAVLDHIEKIE